jgi:hypothetical protein
MKRAHAAAALVLLSGCTAILGVGDDPKDAVKIFCGCDEIRNILSHEPDCVGYLGGKLAAASEDDRSAWLKKYGEDCSHCPDAPACYYMLPMCVRLHESCKSAEECCAYTPGGTVTCTNGTCE